ncbi:hypothetical protein [Aneurinibacillus sp. REN35]|uniref:hypothetical protein n=1 Tax=Aneurinibacillus sp. REN35 TaxID=3237286 RepID=UPI0035294829
MTIKRLLGLLTGTGKRKQAEGFSGDVGRTYGAVEEDFLMIQYAVDHGDNPWRLHPVETARRIGIERLGFGVEDVFRFESQYLDYDSGLHRASIKAQHGGAFFLVELYQPVRQGATGIWAVAGVKPLDGNEI